MCGRIWGLHLACFLFLLVCGSATATLRIDVTRGNTRSTAVAFAPLHSTSNLEHNIASNCTSVMLRNLAIAGNFNVSVVNADLEIDGRGVPASSVWRQFDFDVLLTGSVQELPYGRVKVHLFVWDIASGKELDGKSFNFDMGNWRTAAHTMSDHIFSRLTGEKGLFNSKIAYLTESSSGAQSVAVIDHSDARKDYMSVKIDSGALGAVKFTPDAKYIAFVQNTVEGLGKVMVQGLDEDTSLVLAECEGVGTALSFSPDKKRMLLACSKDRQSDIYSYDLDTQQVTRLVTSAHNKTAASYSPDGMNVVFASDKSGAMHLYVMHEDGSRIKKISSGSGGYKAPAWSPRGNLIAFAKMRGKSCHIGVMRPDGSREKILASGETLDNPTWSPNGRLLMFTKQTKSNAGVVSELVTVDLNGTIRSKLEIQDKVTSLHWSPLLSN